MSDACDAELSQSTATEATYPGTVGPTCGFYSVATDGAGNVQPAKTIVDATTAVSAQATSSCSLRQLATRGIGAGNIYAFDSDYSGPSWSEQEGSRELFGLRPTHGGASPPVPNVPSLRQRLQQASVLLT